jgi:hypothetical protein
MYSEIVREPQFYLDAKGIFFPEATVFILTGKHLSYLVNPYKTPVFQHSGEQAVAPAIFPFF